MASSVSYTAVVETTSDGGRTWLPDGPPLHAVAPSGAVSALVAMQVLVGLPATIEPARVRVWRGYRADLSRPAEAVAGADGYLQMAGRVARDRVGLSRLMASRRPGQVDLYPER